MTFSSPAVNISMEESKPKKKYSKRLTRKTATIEVEGVVVGRNKKVIPPNEVFKALQPLPWQDSKLE